MYKKYIGHTLKEDYVELPTSFLHKYLFY